MVVDHPTKSLFSTQADYSRKREQLEAKEARRHKREFMGFFQEVITTNKIENKGRQLPNPAEKHRVL